MKNLPAGWIRERLKDVAQINASSLPASIDVDYEFDYLEISNVDYYGIVDKEAMERLRYEDAPSRARRRALKNNTLISSVRPNLQAVCFIDSEVSDLICSTGFNVVDPNQAKIFPRFAYYSLISENARQHFESTATGTGYPAVGDKDFNIFSVFFPSLSEQERIAAFLELSCANIDAAVQAKRSQVEALVKLRETTIQQAVTKGLIETVELVETGSQIITQIPKGWKLDRLKDISQIRYGLGQPPAELKGGVPMIRATNIDSGNILEKDLLCVDPDELPLDREPYLKENEIIVVRSGAYTGDSSIIPKKYEGAVAGYDMVVHVTHAESKFIAYSLLSPHILHGQIKLLTLRAAQPHLNAQELGGIIFALPPTREEQISITKYLDERLTEINDVKSIISKQIETLLEYRKSLIHECVTGQRRV